MFNQYLRTTQIPKLEYKISRKKLYYRYANCIKGFTLPVKIKTDKELWITPTDQWQKLPVGKGIKAISIDRNFYLNLEKVK
jgi:hypothetical protein